MGIAKFNRWVSVRYPCLSEVVKEFQNRLLEAIRMVSHLLTEVEKSCNIHGPHLLYTHSETPGDPYPTSTRHLPRHCCQPCQLFKQHYTSSKAKGPVPQQQHHQQQQQQQQGGFQGKKGHSRPANLNPASHRNPVMELLTLCQSLQLKLPLYDYISKNGKFFCVVSLVNGNRFQGSLCNSREEAAESAASVALLQMHTCHDVYARVQTAGHPTARSPVLLCLLSRQSCQPATWNVWTPVPKWTVSRISTAIK
ncbi:hypothetical protein DPMN_123834 [Dreissena polymorpha]|uniref:DRBM domain-containing protein n=1 Tax=Dreissena polymorpha TaxID=45954 RepID=A0A9D4JRN3_DREPO|nr:hypothetical protein DPMN_123834 [Dreissena polymorpha]